MLKTVWSWKTIFLFSLSYLAFPWVASNLDSGKDSTDEKNRIHTLSFIETWINIFLATVDGNPNFSSEETPGIDIRGRGKKGWATERKYVKVK